MFARTTSDLNNRTDVYAAPAVSVTTQAFNTALQTRAASMTANEATRAFQATPRWQRDVSDNIARGLQQRRGGRRDEGR